MKKSVLTLLIAAGTISASAQSAIDAFSVARQDLKGTARFMGMGGAFGALGGDLTTLSYNPGGIGIYRSSDIGMTMDIDIARSTMDFNGNKNSVDRTKFLFNNIGYVGTARLGGVLRNFNWGFTYNRAASFNRRYAGRALRINNSMSNYMAGVANDNGVWLSDLQAGPDFDPYIGSSDFAAPWITVLGYESNLISPTSDNNDRPDFVGLYGSGTSGQSTIEVEEHGGIDEYNIAFGGNFANIVYWGMDFGIMNLDFTHNSLYTEYLDNAYVGVDGASGTVITRSNADWDMENYYNVHGNGWNYKLGVIVKPIQELRIGFAFHTPTWYKLTEEFGANTTYTYPDTGIRNGGAQTNYGFPGYNDYNLRTPWRFIASAAGVIDGRFIISADFDWTSYQHLKLSDPYYNSNDWGFIEDSESNPFYYTNKDVKDYYRTSYTFRAGAEYRVLPDLSLRLGYAHTSSPVQNAAKNDEMTIYTAGTDPSYEFDDATDYITAGIGYRYRHFYLDAAYAYRHRSSEWHAFTPDPDNLSGSGTTGKLTGANSQIVLTLGFKF